MEAMREGGARSSNSSSVQTFKDIMRIGRAGGDTLRCGLA
jgi:hypothetical protein